MYPLLLLVKKKQNFECQIILDYIFKIQMLT